MGVDERPADERADEQGDQADQPEEPHGRSGAREFGQLDVDRDPCELVPELRRERPGEEDPVVARNPERREVDRDAAEPGPPGRSHIPTVT